MSDEVTGRFAAATRARVDQSVPNRSRRYSPSGHSTRLLVRRVTSLIDIE